MRRFIGHLIWYIAYQIDRKFTPSHLNPMDDPGEDPLEKGI